MNLLNKKWRVNVILFCMALQVLSLNAQKQLSEQVLEEHAIHFNISNGVVDKHAEQILDRLVKKSQFTGLAELHRSEQLSVFTSALLPILKRNGCKTMALEIGPHSAEILEKISKENLSEEMLKLNRTYGNKSSRMTPIVFADTKADTLFLQTASNLGFDFLGLDQEFIFSYEMHVDTLFKRLENPTEKEAEIYHKAKKTVSEWGRKSSRKKPFDYNCRLIEDISINDFFGLFESDESAMIVINDLKMSWDIYCKVESGSGSNQQRANYMKENLDSYLNSRTSNGQQKVFVKMGSVHLTKGKSPFGVDDLGKHLQQIAETSNSEYLSIRQLSRYRNGKDLSNNKNWRTVKTFMEAGRKDKWTLLDLRPLRNMLKNKKIKATKSEIFEILSYDLIVIPPDDKRAKLNF